MKRGIPIGKSFVAAINSRDKGDGNCTGIASIQSSVKRERLNYI